MIYLKQWQTWNYKINMKPDEEIVGEAVRVEWEEKSGKLFLVFEISNEKYKQSIKKDWTEDLEFRLIDKKLIGQP
jgi:leucyl aminopeptidase (aminopeptidase T)